MRNRDRGLELHDKMLFIDELGLWANSVVFQAQATVEQPHGLSYSPALHVPDGTRLVGLDDAHRVKDRRGTGWHGERDHRWRLRAIRPYEHKDSASLLEDSWKELDLVLKVGVAIQ